MLTWAWYDLLTKVKVIDSRQDTSLKAKYKKACKETKSVIAKAKHDATKHIYDELDTKEGQVKIYIKLQKQDKDPGKIKWL